MNALVYQIKHYPYPREHTFPPYIPREGESPPRWFERVIHRSKRFTVDAPPSPAATDVSSLTTPSSVQSGSSFAFSSPQSVSSQVTVGNSTLPVGWSIVIKPQIVQRPNGAPSLPVDVTSKHKQVKVKIAPGQRSKGCTMCAPTQKNGVGFLYLKQKKPPFLCIECNQYFYHDIISPKVGWEP